MNNKIKICIVSLTVVFVISLAASLLGVYYFDREFEKTLINVSYSHLETTAHSRADHVESFLRGKTDKVEGLSRDSVFINFLKAGENYNGSLEEVNNRLGELSDASLLDKNGIIVASTDSRKIGINYSEGRTFLENETLSLATVYYDKLEKKDLIGTMVPINDHETGEFLGAIGSTLELAELNEITLDRIGLGETGEVYLINKEKKLLTPSRFMENSLFVQEVDTLNSRRCLTMDTEEHVGHEATEIFLDYRGENVLGTHIYIPEMQWCLLAEIDAAEILGAQRSQFLGNSLIILTLISFFAVLVGFLIGRELNGSEEKKKQGKKVKKKKGKICLKCRYVFSLSVIFAVVYFFVITSFFQGWQNALFYDDIPDLIFITFTLAGLYRAFKLGKESIKKPIILGLSLLLVAKLVEIPLQELQALGLVPPVFWYPIMMMLFLGFLLILFSFKEAIK